jgi:hypothetical protein
MNESRKAPGNAVLIYNSSRIRFAGEIAAKVSNKERARYYWKEIDARATCEFMYRRRSSHSSVSAVSEYGRSNESSLTGGGTIKVGLCAAHEQNEGLHAIP